MLERRSDTPCRARALCCEPSKGFVSKFGEPERAWEGWRVSQREPERAWKWARVSQSEPERARESRTASQREPERAFGRLITKREAGLTSLATRSIVLLQNSQMTLFCRKTLKYGNFCRKTLNYAVQEVLRTQLLVWGSDKPMMIMTIFNDKFCFAPKRPKNVKM